MLNVGKPNVGKYTIHGFYVIYLIYCKIVKVNPPDEFIVESIRAVQPSDCK